MGKPDPTDARGWLARADDGMKRGASDEAVRAYRQAAALYHRDGMYLKAIAIYKQILVIVPGDSDAASELASLLRQLGLGE